MSVYHHHRKTISVISKITELPFPSNIIIIGAGIFGLSTALALSRRHPNTKITIIDRHTAPVQDGSSVNTTRCIRADYTDSTYAHLATLSQASIEADPGLIPYYHKVGMTFVTSNGPDRFTDIWTRQAKLARARHFTHQIIETETPQAVFQHIHGPDVALVSSKLLGRERKWNKAYCNLGDAFINARKCVRVYYECCLAQPTITFRCGVAVERLLTMNGIATGAVLEDGTIVNAECILVAAGAWTPKLVDVEDRMYSSAIEVAWIKTTPSGDEKWKTMSITANLSTGLNIFPPYKGEVKILKRSKGYCNTIKIEHPEEKGERLEVSFPKTGTGIPAEAERALREDLKEIMPDLAERKFDRTKLFWLTQAPTADFLIAKHPRLADVHGTCEEEVVAMRRKWKGDRQKCEMCLALSTDNILP